MFKREPRILVKLKLIFFAAVVLAALNSNSIANVLTESFSLVKVSAAVPGGDRGNSIFSPEEFFGHEKLQKAMKNYNLKTDEPDITKEKISVCVVGEVNFPGQYDISRGSNVLTSILMAGGPTVYGTLRNVKVLIGSDNCQEIDFYEFLLTGDSDNLQVLSGGETVVVEPYEVRVKIEGLVKMPAVYDLKKAERTLGWILRLSGGLVSDVSSCRIEIFRNKKGSQHQVFSEVFDREKGLQGCSDFPLENGDIVRLISLDVPVKKEIELIGHFRFPGKVVLNKKVYLSDLVTRENLMYGYAPKYAEILREAKVGDEYEVLSFAPEKIIKGEKAADIELKDGDKINVFSEETFGKFAKVAVDGWVKRSGVFFWKEGMHLLDLINLAGGLKKNASSVAQLTRRDIVDGKLVASTLIIDLHKALKGDPRHNVEIQPFDLLLIEHKSDK
ncbi:MAG: hypothetical protein Kow0029_03080 [Candidatus Rifleibacteriota bacterium]